MKKAHVLLFDGYADWETGHILAELKRIGQAEIVTVGFNENPVISMGGLEVRIHKALDQIDYDDVLIFIVPGGIMWEEGYPEEALHDVLRNLDSRCIPVAAICAATTVLAKAGILAGKKHTSNSLSYMKKMVPDYSDDDNYIDRMAVTGRHVITASGLGSVDFTMEILTALNITTPEMRTLWYDAFKHGQYPEEYDHPDES